MKKIAIPYSNGKLCSRFCHASHFFVFKITGEVITSIELKDAPDRDFHSWPEWLADLGITHIIVKFITERVKINVEKNNIQIIMCTSDKSPVDVIDDYLHKNLVLQKD